MYVYNIYIYSYINIFEYAPAPLGATGLRGRLASSLLQIIEYLFTIFQLLGTCLIASGHLVHE